MKQNQPFDTQFEGVTILRAGEVWEATGRNQHLIKLAVHLGFDTTFMMLDYQEDGESSGKLIFGMRDTNASEGGAA